MTCLLYFFSLDYCCFQTFKLSVERLFWHMMSGSDLASSWHAAHSLNLENDTSGNLKVNVMKALIDDIPLFDTSTNDSVSR
jgi:hypothetical protein